MRRDDSDENSGLTERVVIVFPDLGLVDIQPGLVHRLFLGDLVVVVVKRREVLSTGFFGHDGGWHLGHGFFHGHLGKGLLMKFLSLLG